MQPAQNGRPLPWPNEITQPFFEAVREGRLALQRCPRDGFFYYPRGHCPGCLGTDWSWETVEGRGEVHAFTVDRVGHTPGLAPPVIVAAIELTCGPRLTARLIGCEPEAVSVGLPVEAAYEHFEDVTVLAFRPATA